MQLAQRDKELAAIGSSIGCNCGPCVDHHIPKGREAGLSEAELEDAVATARALRDQGIELLAPRIQELLGSGSGHAHDGWHDRLERRRVRLRTQAAAASLNRSAERALKNGLRAAKKDQRSAAAAWEELVAIRNSAGGLDNPIGGRDGPLDRARNQMACGRRVRRRRVC